MGWCRQPKAGERMTMSDNRDVQQSDLYAVLGVNCGASATEIRRAFMRQVKDLRPELRRNSPSASERLKRVNYAFGILKNEFRKTEDSWKPDFPPLAIPRPRIIRPPG